MSKIESIWHTVFLPVVTGKKETSGHKWDVRGFLPLPWQGIACIDMTDDASFIAVGTIAPSGDANVFLLDRNGRVVSQHKAGVRWINEVAVANDGRLVAAICTTPEGKAGDCPAMYTFSADEVSVENLGGAFFHYGEHSNHLGVFLRNARKDVVMASGDRVTWLSSNSETPKQTVHFHHPGILTTFDVSATGRAVVGCATTASNQNLFVLQSSPEHQVWSRDVSFDVEASPSPEKGTCCPVSPG